jgi:2'-5' RNA ligase
MRVFIAIDIDEVIKQDLADLQRELQGKADIKKGDAKWGNPDDIHLTLKFLGEIKDAQAVEVCNITKDVAGRHARFDIDVQTVGHFGGKSARVLWVGSGHGCEELLQLQQDLEEQMALAGWPEEGREFSAHLTLCRVRNSKAGFKLAQLAEEYKDFKLGTMPAEAVSVYQSQLTPSGPVYTVLGRYELK